MIFDNDIEPRRYHGALSFGWSNAFVAFGEAPPAVSVYFDPAFNVMEQATDDADKLKARDPRPPAGRLTRR